MRGSRAKEQQTPAPRPGTNSCLREGSANTCTSFAVLFALHLVQLHLSLEDHSSNYCTHYIIVKCRLIDGGRVVILAML